MSNEADISRFDAVYQYLLENFQSEITLEAVSKKCNMTPNAFCRYFKNKTQKTLTLFLNELRIGHACKLLQVDNSSIQHICYDCGNNNPVNFFKFFKTITHNPPVSKEKILLKYTSNNLGNLNYI
jgi:AraC-like DNA-binding protein